MGWSVEVHERQRLAEAAAARRPKRAAASEPRPIESGVWRVSAGSKTVTALAVAVVAALWARQQRLAKSQQPDSLLGRLGSAVSARLQALGIADWLDRARGRNLSSTGSRKQKQRKLAHRSASQAAGDAAQQRSSAAAAAAAAAVHPEAAQPVPPPDEGTSGGSGSSGSPEQGGAPLDAAPASAPAAAPAQTAAHARPAEQRGGQRKKKGKGKRKK